MSDKLSQFVGEVVNFSSQYGTQGSNSYTASNLAGDLRVYDRYGDFVEAFVLRTYGQWWHRCPSAARRLKKSSSTFISQDFVELRYSTPVVPTDINIYETYHPGAVVRILACNANPTSSDEKKRKPGEVEWVTLWSGSPQCSKEAKAKKFSPTLKKITFPTNLIRLEFNSEDCGYYTELDGAELCGYKLQASSAFHDRALGFRVSLTTQLLRQLSLSDRQTSISSDDEEFEKWGYFGMLPDEVIQHIFEFLDVKSLCAVAQTCSLLLKNAYDPWLYSELDLQSHWNTLDDVALEGLMSRCSNIHHLSLSWTGGGGQITEPSLCRFLEECGSELLTLRLACCKYIGKSTLSTIGRVCTKLQELDLQSCLQLRDSALVHIGELSQLKRLNLYSCNISAALLNVLGSKCQTLEHLNIGASVQQLGEHISTTALNKCLANLKSLVSLDLWRCKFASHDTLATISDNCHNLEEIDIGWCHAIFRSVFDHEYFFKGCTKLKKVFLTCGRHVDDECLESIAKYCPGLEQLDILGTNKVSSKGITKILQSCRKLTFFDVSFCSQIQSISEFQPKFPNVCFKKSFS